MSPERTEQVLVSAAWTENVPEQGHWEEHTVCDNFEENAHEAGGEDGLDFARAARKSSTAVRTVDVYVVDVQAQTIEHPAVYETRTIPAEYRTETVNIPAEYRTETVNVPAEYRTETVPAVTEQRCSCGATK